jgi:hypothetical protein
MQVAMWPLPAAPPPGPRARLIKSARSGHAEVGRHASLQPGGLAPSKGDPPLRTGASRTNLGATCQGIVGQ